MSDKTSHPFKVGDRVTFCGKSGTVRKISWETRGRKPRVPHVTIAIDDQGNRRPHEPERLYRTSADGEVSLISAVEQLGELA